jgi:hypothetical protein
MKKIGALLIGLMIVSLVLSVGCTSSTPYEQPAQVVQTTSSKIVTSTPQSIVKKFSIGETATDGKLKITLNSKRFADKITMSSSTSINGQSYTSNMDFKPIEGKQFLILDITIENLQPDKTQTISTLLQFTVSDADGYSYPYSFYTAYLDKKFSGGDLLPGQKMRGEAAFEVPTNPNGLQFAFKFDYSGKTAVYTI